MLCNKIYDRHYLYLFTKQLKKKRPPKLPKKLIFRFFHLQFFFVFFNLHKTKKNRNRYAIQHYCVIITNSSNDNQVNDRRIPQQSKEEEEDEKEKKVVKIETDEAYC